MPDRVNPAQIEGLIDENETGMPKYDPNDPEIQEAWFMISARRAAQASGLVRAIIMPGGFGPETVLNAIELPAAQNNPLVTGIEFVTYNP